MQPSHNQIPNQKELEKKVNYAHSLMAAGASGLVGAYAAFFFEGTKKRLQSNQSLPNPIKLGPKNWLKESFRGSSSFAGSLVPTSMIQQMTSHYFAEKNLSHTPGAKTAEAIFSGSLGGLASTVVENIVLEQQLRKIGIASAFNNLLSQGQTRIFRGLPLIMVREAIFGFCYMKGAKEAGDYVTKHHGEGYALSAQLIVGALGSLASHPFDTTATTMQRYGYNHIGDAVSHLWKENKFKAFYKGGLARIGLFTTAMLTISNVQEKVLAQLENINHKQQVKI